MAPSCDNSGIMPAVTAPANPDPLWHIAFYAFATLPDPEAVAARLRELTRGLTGSILVAAEGINGVAAGVAASLDAFEQALLDDAVFAGRFAGMVFKRSECRTMPFARMKVHVKREIVAFGVTGVNAPDTRDTHVSPQAWRELIARDNVVVLDNRNSFEYRLGKFRSAIDPGVLHFRDFPRYVEQQAPQWKAEGKRIAMYCTGGIRCEKSAAWMQALGLDVYQLEGGVLNYFQSMPDADKDWQGECFVFDNRIALDTKLCETNTTLEQVYDGEPDGQWRLERARRLDAAT
jgi:UPF0176 protein